jgi:hypothetical protein
MKFWFRIGAKQHGQQPRVSRSLAEPKARLWPPGGTSGPLFLPPERFSGMRLSLVPPANPSMAPATRKSLKIARFFAKWAPTSNRKWAKSRCYRKQMTKPCLTEARTHIRDFGFVTLFPSSLAAANRERRSLRATKFFHPNAAKSGVRVRHLYRRRMLLLRGETATNGLHRTHPE